MITAMAFVVASAAGAMLRALVGQLINEDKGVAYGTLAVNVIGSFALGALQSIATPSLTVLGVGFMGSFTTFSSFTRDVVALVEFRKLLAAFAYLTVTLSASIGAAALGLWCS